MYHRLQVVCLVIIAVTLMSLNVLVWRVMQQHALLTNMLSLTLTTNTQATQQLSLIERSLYQQLWGPLAFHPVTSPLLQD